MQDSRPMAATTAFLAGLRVLDLSIWRPGPYATSLLVPLGADVLKVEPPGGDPMRHYAGLFAAINGGKRSVELDLKNGSGQARAVELATPASSTAPSRATGSTIPAPPFPATTSTTRRGRVP